MSYVIYHGPLGGFIVKRDGMNIGVENPEFAKRFDTRRDAVDARPGHSRDMGGNGYVGCVMSYGDAIRAYEEMLRMRPRRY